MEPGAKIPVFYLNVKGISSGAKDMIRSDAFLVL
jgi:hypothetical protein